MTVLADLMAMPAWLALLALATCFAAGAVRGFSGFGLSALAMSVLAVFIAPIELVPVFWWLETSASLVLMKGGWADADRPTAITLFIASGLALPVALIASGLLDPTVAKTVALSALIVLALAQLSRLKIPALASKPGTAASGALAGLITGFAGAGGMVIALYALARDLPARTMRGTLNIYLLGGGALGLITHLAVGTMTAQATTRGLVLMPVALAGVFAGRALFTPRLEPYYKPFCLVLLLGLACLGLVRLLGEPI